MATDRGIFFKMQQAVPEKTLFEAPTAGNGATCKSCAHCPWMAMNALDNLAGALRDGSGEIHVDDALRLANDSRYGLQAGIFTADLDTAMKAARRLDFGGVLINEVPTWRADRFAGAASFGAA